MPVGEGPRATAVSACGAGHQAEHLAMVSGEDARRQRQDEAVCEQVQQSPAWDRWRGPRPLPSWPQPLALPGSAAEAVAQDQGRGLPAPAQTSCPEAEQRLPPTLCTAGAIP